jgi:2,3-bisphosphoglycerate-independent phosphoglycerate mutase
MLAWSPHATLSRRPGPVVLCILDGVGLGSGGPDDAVAQARTPNLDRLRQTSPFAALRAHGVAVGLPSDEDMGNSEVGHNAMGAGRVFDQGAKLVDAALASGAAFRSDVWRDLVRGNTLHLLGLLSDGNVHSNVSHLHALIDAALRDGVKRLRVHILTDGRDVAARSALQWVEPLEAKLASLSTGGRDYRIASGGGRMWITMDRYGADWAMVERGWRCHVEGEGRRFASASQAISTFYAEDPIVNDQFLPAFVVVDDRGPVGTIVDGDSVLLFNFRGDRAIEISRAFEEPGFAEFTRHRPAVTFAGMMRYDGDLGIPKRYLVAPPQIDRTVGQYLAAAGLRTFAVSETQKFGHVTYFFNGNRSGRIDEQLERYLEVPSDVRPFAERPWMKAAEITDAAVDAIASGGYDHVRLNFANGDMVGHTGVLEATILAVEAFDLQLGRLIAAVARADGILLVTADHGNADEMWMKDKKGAVQRDPGGGPLPKTSHTLALVPFLAFDPRNALAVRPVEAAGIASVGTTLLELCGIAAPEGYAPGLLEAR